VTPLAEECRYVYKGAAGDPYYTHNSLYAVHKHVEMSHRHII